MLDLTINVIDMNTLIQTIEKLPTVFICINIHRVNGVSQLPDISYEERSKSNEDKTKNHI